MDLQIFRALTSAPGYHYGQIQSEKEFNDIKNIITSEFSRLSGRYDLTFDDLSKAHLIDGIEDCISSFSVFMRTVKQQSAMCILNHKWIREVSDQLQLYPIDSYGFGYPTFTWRLTRPWQTSDYRSVHRDCWFRYATSGPLIIDDELPKPIQTVKLWLAVNVEVGNSGLLISPNSHIDTSFPSFSVVNRDNLVKPLISSEDVSKLDLMHATTPDSSYILFGEQLVHGGAPTNSDLCRISLEMTFASKAQTLYRIFIPPETQ